MKQNHEKCQKVLVFKTFLTCGHFFLYIMFFSLFIEIFSSILLTFVISVIKDFNINDSDLLGFCIYTLNIKSNRFCIKSSVALNRH